MVEGLAVLSFENSKKLLDEHAPRVQIPWLFVKSNVFSFVFLLREKGIFLAKSMDNETANFLQETIFVDGKDVTLPVPQGEVVVCHLLHAKKTLDQIGTEIVPAWQGARDIVSRFLDHLYAHSIFIVEAREGAGALVKEKTSVNNLYLRIKKPVPVSIPATPTEAPK